MKTRITRTLSLTAYLALILFLMAWIVFLGGVARTHVSVYLVLFVTPLLLPLRGILAARGKAMVWGVLVSLPYILHGSFVALTDLAQRWLGLVEAALGLGYLVTASLYIRWRAASVATTSNQA